MSKAMRSRLRTFSYHTFVLFFGFLMIYPVLWMLASSLKPHEHIFTQAYALIPKRVVFQNYATGWKGFGNNSFATFFANSFKIVVPATIGVVLSSAMAAFGFARVRFRLSKLWFTCMIITMLLPMQVLMIPQYILFNKLGWTDSYAPIIVPAFCGQAFFIFLNMQFIQGIPIELDESATIDGCGKFGIFLRVMVPLIWPAMITSMIFSFYWRWEDYLGPLLYVRTASKYPLSIALKLFSDPASVTDYGAMFAMSVLSLVPVFAIFVAFQRYLVEGISTTGLKG